MGLAPGRFPARPERSLAQFLSNCVNHHVASVLKSDGTKSLQQQRSWLYIDISIGRFSKPPYALSLKKKYLAKRLNKIHDRSIAGYHL
jgi:hypothetical protein